MVPVCVSIYNFFHKIHIYLEM
ncbi:protein of unknown function [Rhodovastum atsumiense]|nr:protein of unknown function [Rhodovastum atsumiense]